MNKRIGLLFFGALLCISQSGFAGGIDSFQSGGFNDPSERFRSQQMSTDSNTTRKFESGATYSNTQSTNTSSNVSYSSDEDAFVNDVNPTLDTVPVDEEATTTGSTGSKGVFSSLFEGTVEHKEERAQDGRAVKKIEKKSGRQRLLDDSVIFEGTEVNTDDQGHMKKREKKGSFRANDLQGNVQYKEVKNAAGDRSTQSSVIQWQYSSGGE